MLALNLVLRVPVLDMALSIKKKKKQITAYKVTALNCWHQSTVLNFSSLFKKKSEKMGYFPNWISWGSITLPKTFLLLVMTFCFINRDNVWSALSVAGVSHSSGDQLRTLASHGGVPWLKPLPPASMPSSTLRTAGDSSAPPGHTRRLSSRILVSARMDSLYAFGDWTSRREIALFVCVFQINRLF